MPRYLAFTLHAPLAAFGGVAVGERRPGWDRPGRSAVIGLLAAALGVDRSDEAAERALDGGYGLAIRTDAAGRMLADYHTAQVAAASRKRPRLPTRAAELALPELETVLTRREYRTDALHVIALCERADAPYRLAVLAAALSQPAFVLYVGRKSCPLGLPLAPLLVEAPDAPTALVARAAAAARPEQRLRRLFGAQSGAVAMDADMATGLDVQRIERRRDRSVSRLRWQFALREEAILRLDAPESA